MRRLRDCARLEDGVITDEKTEQTLTLVADVPIAAYRLDDDAVWGTDGKRPDAVVVAADPDPGIVLFLELKGTLRHEETTKVDRAFNQVLAGIKHFCADEQHGTEHHDAWRGDRDLPQARKGRHLVSVVPGAAHRVLGAIVTSRGGARILPRQYTIGGKRVVIAVVQKHGVFGDAELGLDELTKRIGP